MSKTTFRTKLTVGLAALTIAMLVTAANAQTETVLHNFQANGADGFNPDAGVAVDAAGNVYGTTSGGGAFNFGTVYKVTPSGTETVLHSFNADGVDGTFPFGSSVVLDAAGTST